MSTTATRTARCLCGDLSLTLSGEPLLVSSCCCQRCQRRTGAFYGVTVYFRPPQVVGRTGEPRTFHLPDGETTFHFCPRCGANLYWVPDEMDEDGDIFGVAGGSFAGQDLPAPDRMVWTRHRRPFVCDPTGVPQFGEGPD